MRKTSLWLAACFALAFHSSAQVSLELELEQDQFLPGESVPIAVRITNRSGRTLEMGDSPDWLTFALDCDKITGSVVPRTSDVPVEGAFSLPSSKRAIKRVDLAPHFTLTTPGKYAVVANVRVPGWNDIVCPPVHFYVLDGTRIWEQEVGLPAASTNSTPEVRRYVLQQANHLRGTPKLYVRITDANGNLIKLHLVGYILSFSRPYPQVDSQSNLHLLYQNGPSGFRYTVFTPYGELVKRQAWDFYGESRPRLTLDKAGQIVVTGGIRRATNEDIPPSTSQNAPEVSKR